jgi:hypothetical protein
MPYSISTLLIRNLRDVFGENDHARRRAAIDEIFTEDCVSLRRDGFHHCSRRADCRRLSLFRQGASAIHSAEERAAPDTAALVV